MKPTPQHIQLVYLVLMLCYTLASSLIWGINTLFLLDAGLTNTQAFLANAFFTLGQVIFEIPTGIVADIKGRRVSYLLGTITLSFSTLLYVGAWYIHAPVAVWAISSILLGLGFTFFSGATEAWVVDALNFAGYKKSLESIFAKGQMVGGIAMLLGSVGGGLLAQNSNVSAPYILRILLILVATVVAFFYMKDWGFTPAKKKDVFTEVKEHFSNSFTYGLKNPAIRWVMIASLFGAGIGVYTFYAMQPFLVQLYGDPNAYGIAGLAAAIVAGAQVVGGMSAKYIHKVFKRRTTVFLSGVILNVIVLIGIGITTQFYVAIIILCLWGLIFAALEPVRRAYLNALIPSQQRATVLSFDSLLGSAGGVLLQPSLGKVADVWSYSASFLGAAVFQILALPFVLLARKEKTKADNLKIGN